MVHPVTQISVIVVYNPLKLIVLKPLHVEISITNDTVGLIYISHYCLVALLNELYSAFYSGHNF